MGKQMIFTTIGFWEFYLIVILLIFINARVTQSVKAQNCLLLIASYYFYTQWNWRYLVLIIINTLVSFFSGLCIKRSGKPKLYLIFAVLVNIGILSIFKYYNFFINSFTILLNALSINTSHMTLSVLLPVGISFYTFQNIAYVVDIYKNRMEPVTDLIKYSTFISFFPQLVAGPIERARNLLPQFDRLWKFDEKKWIEGLRLILFGLTLKILVADNLDNFVNLLFSMPPSVASGGDYLLGSFYFAFQIYGDFCGYSTIAIGVAKILGIELMTNFRTPYFSFSFQEFWHRWHISLSTFFRDYVYIPLGGSRVSEIKIYRNILITFALSGLWHGANWTFVIWGTYHGILLCIERLSKNRFSMIRRHELISKITGSIITFSLTCFGWIIFRSESIDHLYGILKTIPFKFSFPTENLSGLKFVFCAIIIDILWIKDTRLERFVMNTEKLDKRKIRWLIYTAMLWLFLSYAGIKNGAEFIYFQF